MSKPEIKGTVCIEALRKFPKHGMRTLARMIYNDNIPLFSSVESARNCLRRYSGKHGPESRTEKKTASGLVRPLQMPGDNSYPKLPRPSKEFMVTTPFVIDSDEKVLIVPDVHIPYHDPLAIKTCIDYGKKNGATMVILNGDVMDFYEQSRWQKDPRRINWKDSKRKGIEFLQWLRGQFPKARIIWKPGNHDDRWQNYLIVNAPVLFGDPTFELPAVFELNKVGIEMTAAMQVINLGKLNVIHGHEYRFAIANPVNPARGLFLRAKCHAMTSHFHQTSSHSEKNIEDKVVTTFSTGCLCNLKPSYMPINNHNHGAAMVYLSKGDFETDNGRIVHGKWFR